MLVKINNEPWYVTDAETIYLFDEAATEAVTELKKPDMLKRIGDHINRNQTFYKVAGLSVVLFLGLEVDVFAAGGDIDAKAREIYFGKLLKFGKWAIIFKGGWDTIMKTIKEDFDGAKKSFLAYLLVYVILLGLPWMMDQVEGVFDTKV